jgi:hypothetical protein
MLRKTIKSIAWVVFSLVVLAGAVFGATRLHFNPSPPKASYPKPADALAAQRQDLDYFRKLIALDRAFTPAARAEAERRIGALECETQPLERAHFRVALMQIMALADNGHSHVGYDPAATPRELPVRVALFSDGAYVMRTTDAAADLLGGRIVSIDGKPIDQVLARLATLRGGPPQWRREYASVYLTFQDMLFGLDVATDADRSTWTVIAPTGATVTRVVDAYVPPESEADPFVKRWLSSEPLKNLTEGWRSFQPDAPLPIALKDFDTTFRQMRLPGSCSHYVQFKSNMDDGDQHIGDFTAQTRDALNAQPPCALIVDMRYNDGGNYLTTALFMRNLPEYLAPAAPIYLLTGPSTFSAGIVSTAFIKQSGGERVTVIGEPVGDRAQFFSEGGRGCLPNYALCVFYETGKHDYQQPCSDIAVCFWPNYLFPTRVKSFDPDETIRLSFADWRAGRDPVFERALELAKSKSTRS